VSCFRFIAAEKANFPISLLCRMLGVSRSGFHAWASRPPSRRALEDARLSEQIRSIHTRSRGTYGARRVHAELRQDGIRVGRKRVERLMRAAGLSGQLRRRRPKKTTISIPGVRLAGDLVQRDFRPSAPNRLWVADLTCLATAEGWLYLAAVLDCFSRRIVGWSMADRATAEMVVDALEMAVVRRRPERGLVHHSDQGTQYVSLLFGERCRDVGIEVSMGSKGDCYDNAVVEAFFASFKKELVSRRSFRSRQEARTAIFDYIEGFYNPIRRHSTLDYLSPAEYERIKEERAEAA
jgi:putative transposase